MYRYYKQKFSCLALVLLLSSIGLLIDICQAEILDSWNDPRAYRPAPVLFLHGFALGDPQIWKDTREGTVNVSEKLNKYFEKYIRNPIALENTTLFPYLEIISFIDHSGWLQELVDRNSSIDTFMPCDYYVLKKLRKTGDFGWSDKLDFAIEDICNTYNTQQVLIVAHSMGGLAARDYITNCKYGRPYLNIPRVIMIGTPNLGSLLANVPRTLLILQKIGWFTPKYGWVLSMGIKGMDAILKYWCKIDLRGDAVKDMAPQSHFLKAFHSRDPHSSTISYFAIAGKYLFFSNDGIVSINSQLAAGESIISDQVVIRANHADEPYVAIEGDNPILRFLDCTTPVLEITSPDPNHTTEIQDTTIHVKGRVFDEYLPADSILSIDVTRQENGSKLPTQTSFLKPSDLWIPGVSDVPVAEFDENILFPGAGTYKIEAKVTNPAGITSLVKEVWVKVKDIPPDSPIVKIFPIENMSLAVGVCTASSVYETIRWGHDPRLMRFLNWDAFIAGQSIRKYYDKGDDKVYYGGGFHRSYLSFDTSILDGKNIRSAALIMFCNNKNLQLGGVPFYVRIYNGNWERIIGTIESWNAGDILVMQKHCDFITSGTFDNYAIPVAFLNIKGKTQFRISSGREEELAEPVEPPLAEGTCLETDHSKMVAEFIHWDRGKIWLEVELE